MSCAFRASYAGFHRRFRSQSSRAGVACDYRRRGRCSAPGRSGRRLHMATRARGPHGIAIPARPRLTPLNRTDAGRNSCWHSGHRRPGREECRAACGKHYRSIRPDHSQETGSLPQKAVGFGASSASATIGTVILSRAKILSAEAGLRSLTSVIKSALGRFLFRECGIGVTILTWRQSAN
jgi:hypothetical protein